MTMSPFVLALTIAGMMLVTFLPRLLPTLFVAAATLPDPVVRWLRMVPPAVISALLLTSLTAPSGELDLSVTNAMLWLAIPTLVLARLTRSFSLTILFGIAALAAVRLLTG